MLQLMSNSLLVPHSIGKVGTFILSGGTQFENKVAEAIRAERFRSERVHTRSFHPTEPRTVEGQIQRSIGPAFRCWATPTCCMSRSKRTDEQPRTPKDELILMDCSVESSTRAASKSRAFTSTSPTAARRSRCANTSPLGKR